MLKLIYKYFLLILFSIFFCKNIYSTHIVGGDFKITMSNNSATGADYFFQLKLFRDAVNGNPLAGMPTTANIGIYDAVTHSQVSTVTLNLTTNSIVPLGDPCYTPDPNVVQIEEGVLVNTLAKFLPNNPNGYYVQYENFARNAIIDNIANPGATGITIFAMFPNPALGQNSSPDFGVYPSDAYFCVNNTKLMTFPVIDPDGDSLVYSLVDPMDGAIAGGGTSPGSGNYPFYPSCLWAAGFSLANIVGGAPAMSIDPVSGVISATPNMLGFFAYTVRVEEYRNGTKIGEVRRDVQYASLSCTIAVPPELAVDGLNGQFPNYSIPIDVSVNDTSCFDIDVAVTDPTDSVYIKPTSSNFNLVNNYQTPNTIGANSFSYDDWEDIIGNTVIFNGNNLTNGYYGNLSNVYLRYCWVPACDLIDSVFNITFDIYSVDVNNSACGGVTSSQADLQITVNQSPNDSIVHNIVDSFCVDYILNGQTYTSPGSYTQTLISSSGCDSTIVLDLSQANINLNIQTIDESCFAGNGEISVMASGADSPYTYSLDGVVYSDSIFDSLASGTYTVSVSSQNGCNSNQNIVINNVVFQIDTVLLTHISCIGLCDGIIEVNANTGVTYHITGSQNITDSSSVFDSLCPGNYMVFAENSNGCSDSLQVVLNSPSALTASISSDTMVCINGNVNSLFQANGGTGNITINWSNGTIGDSALWTVANDTSISAFGLDSMGCSTDTITQNVQTYPPLTLVMSPDTTLCNTNSTLIYGLVSGGLGTGYSFSWDNSLSDSSQHYVTPVFSQDYNLIVTDGCETPSVSGITTVTVLPVSPVNFTADILEGCVPLLVTFDESISDSTGTCSWDFGDQSVSSQSGIVTHVFDSVGCWDISLNYSDTSNCSRFSVYDSLICTYENPVSDFSFSPTDISLINNFTRFNNNSSSNATQFLWELSNSNYSETFNTEELNYSFENLSVGSYSMCLISYTVNGCTDTICKEVNLKDDFVFYIPNGFTADGNSKNDEFGPIMKGAADNNYSMTIYNRWGELIFETSDINERWDGKNMVTGNLCPLGVYVWNIQLTDIINSEDKKFIGNVTLLR